jgi:predicted ABC-type ATPase
MSFPISQEQDETQFTQIVEVFAGHLTPAPMPAFHVVIGQPGSGKTELIDLIRSSLEDNILLCNADDLRNYHPEYVKIMRDYESEATDITWPFARDWNNRLIGYGVEKRLNVLIETTGKDRELVLKTLLEKKAAGYITNMHILAIPKRFSWLGIHLRYESMRNSQQFGRIVTDAQHQERFEKLCENVPALVESAHLDHITVYTRSPVMRLDDRCPIVALAATKETSSPAFKEAIAKKMGLEELNAFYGASSRISDLMRRRNVPELDIQAFEEKARKLGSEE